MCIRDSQRANKVIYQTARTQVNCEGMGTTVVAGLFFDDRLTIAHVGDSRMYLSLIHISGPTRPY